MIRFVCLFFSIAMSFTVCESQKKGDSEKLKLITNFVDAAKDGRTSNDEIIQKFLLIDSTKQNLDFVRSLLTTLRTELSRQDATLSFKTYYEAESISKPFSGSSINYDNLYFVLDKGLLLCPVLIESNNNRIVSFSSLNKGGRRILVMLK